ncbi:hypothetical protein AB0I55_28425 [Actinocatenispora sera]|uniref:hypothetical protein n=1 Tax=Actinocatenispora sera TaxID=390989 RepID=UPI0033DDB0BF
MPADPTPFDGPQVDVEARLGWLLRVSRLTADDPDNRSLAGFAARLRATGSPAGTPQISRWETGRLPAPAAIFARYETILGLPAGSLGSIAVGLRSALGAPRPVVPPAPPDIVALRRRYDLVHERLEDAEVAGGTWLAFADILRTDGLVVLLHSRVLDALLARLIDEMMRSVGIAYTTRFTALATLLTRPGLTADVVGAIDTGAREPGAQGVVDAISLLGELGDAAAAGRLLALLAGDDATLRLGAAHALLNMANVGTLPARHTAAMGRILHRLDEHDPAVTVLAGRAPLPAPRCPPPAPVRRRPPPAADRFALVAHARTGLEFDPMLCRLVAEAVASRYTERRHHAALLLLASPYRAAVAEVATGVVGTDPDAATRRGAAGLLRYVVGPPQVPALRRWLRSERADLRAAALGALPHAGVPAEAIGPDLAAGAGRPPRPTGPVIYAAGMTGHPLLRRWADDPATEPSVRRTARWWLRHGPAVLH